MSTITKEQLESYELNHQHAGNGWMMVEDIDDDWCRVVSSSLNQAFLVWKKKISISKIRERYDDPESPMVDVKIREGHVKKQLMELRKKIKSGQTTVVNTRFF